MGISVLWCLVSIYLDHAAGGPLHPAAREAMLPWLTDRFGNPSGAHRVARAAREAIDAARDSLSEVIGCAAGGIVFTSGGTEADNLAVLGSLARGAGCAVVSAVEHPAVFESARASGKPVRVAAVDSSGVVDPARLRSLLDRDVALVSVQAVNHETGVIQPLREIALTVRRHAPGALFHCDAVQAAAWMELGEIASLCDLVSVSGHKWGGPQGIGALAVARPHVLRPVIHGGGQERELRSGTQNVAGAVGLAAAASAAASSRAETAVRVAAMRDELSRRIKGRVPDCVETASEVNRVPGHLHLRFAGVESEALLVLLDEAGICASAGAACASGAMEPSPVLLAMGLEKDDALSSLRLTLGQSNRAEEIPAAADAVTMSVIRLRGGG